MNERMERYSAYMHGDHWPKLRAASISERGYRCEVCHKRDFINCHHVTYRDPLESCTTDDIMVLCRRCHNLAHSLPSINRLPSISFMGSREKRHKTKAAIVAHLGGDPKVAKMRKSAEKSRLKRLKKLRKMQPMREIKKPWKRWKEYNPSIEYQQR